MKQRIYKYFDEYHALWWLVLYTRRAMHKVRTKELSQVGISNEEAAVLLVSHILNSRATPAEISRWLLREPHSISSLLHRMETKGLVKNVKDLKRKNMIRVEPTAKGKQAYDESEKRHSIHRIISALNNEQRKH
ncbi:MarR family winged helix-turn-helix transcriptional regulator, partial [Chloroflexota bacterium]